MTLKECYKIFGGNYENVVSRLVNEALVRKILIKFLSDKSFADILENLKADKPGDAFCSAHTLKGVCQNLGFDNLLEPAVEVTEALRNGKNNTTPEMLKNLKKRYEETISAIKELE